MEIMNDEHGKRSSTRMAGFILCALLVAVIATDVWSDRAVGEVVYSTLETLILAQVIGVSARGLTKNIRG